MRFSKTFFKFAAICAISSGFTTFLLWALQFGYSSPSNINEQMDLPNNIYYMARLWVNFIHIFLALVSYWAIFAAKAEDDAGFLGIGFIFFLIWGITELLGVSILIFAQNYGWRLALTNAADEAAKSSLLANINAFAEIWNAMFFLLLIAFLLATLIYGLVLWRGKGLEKLLSVCFLLAVPLTIFIILGGYANFTLFTPLVIWIYPLLQPLSRILMGVWLWKDSVVDKQLTAVN